MASVETEQDRIQCERAAMDARREGEMEQLMRRWAIGATSPPFEQLGSLRHSPMRSSLSRCETSMYTDDEHRRKRSGGTRHRPRMRGAVGAEGGPGAVGRVGRRRMRRGSRFSGPRWNGCASDAAGAQSPTAAAFVCGVCGLLHPSGGCGGSGRRAVAAAPNGRRRSDAPGDEQRVPGRRPMARHGSTTEAAQRAGLPYAAAAATVSALAGG